MQNINVSYKEYKNFGRCVVLSSPNAELYATLDIGPRIIRYAPSGCENFFNEDIDRNHSEGNQVMDEAYYPGSKWYNYGGHRLWLSPEYMPETYYPDNNPVECIEIENGVILKPPAQKYNLVQLEMEITMSKMGEVEVIHRSTNVSPDKKRFALWSLSVMDIGGVQVLPQPDKQTGFLANRNLVLWPYTDMSDERIHWSKKYITLKQDVNAKGPLKMGMSFVTKAAYIKGTNAFIKRFDWIENAEYPDFGVNYETYTNQYILELESLSPLYDVESDKSIQHIEHWSIKRDVDVGDDYDDAKLDNIFE